MELQLDENGLPVLSQFSEEGFIDCVLEIQNLKLTNSHISFHLASSHHNTILGIDVEIVRGIKAGFTSEMKLNKEHVYRKGVKFSRTGQESDKLMQTLAQLYELKEKNLHMVSSATFTAIALHQEPMDLEAEPTKLKLFGKDRDEDAEDDYFESFFNIDLPNGLVFWNEKDPDYRQSLIRGLTVNVV